MIPGLEALLDGYAFVARRNGELAKYVRHHAVAALAEARALTAPRLRPPRPRRRHPRRRPPHVDKARALITATGYHRRDEELAALERELAH